MDLFAKILFSAVIYFWEKHHLSCLAEFWMYLWNMSIFFILFRKCLWQWYVLKAFTKDLNEYKNLQKLVYCLITHRGSASIFIIFENAWSLFFFLFFFFQLSFNPLNAKFTKWSTHSNNSSANWRRIVWVCLSILWDWRLKGQLSMSGGKTSNKLHFIPTKA